MGLNLDSLVHGVANKILGGDITPGFNITASAGGGIPFISAGNGSTGVAPKATSAQPNTKADPPKINETGLTGGLAGSYGGSGGSSIYDPQAALTYDLGIDQANGALGRLDSQLGTGLGNIESQYNQGYNTLLGQQAVADRNYNTGKTNQLQDYQSAREGVASNTRNLLLNTRRLLGANGAGGGSADRYAAPAAAQQEGNNQNAVVKKTNSRNLVALDTGYDDDKRNIQGSMADLLRQRQQGENSYKSQVEQQRADLLNTIATLTGQKTINNGGSLAQAQAAVNPYTSRIGGILNTIDSLAANPATIRANQVQLAAPDLQQYSYDRFNAPTIAQQDPGLVRAYQTLLGNQDDQKQQLVLQ